MSEFRDKIISVVYQIPKGKVASYGQIALYVDAPRAARQVGWVLNKCGEAPSFPWWRVINNAGRISIKGSEYSAIEQKSRLESEGIKVSENLEIDIEKYRWKV